ncbi:MAG: hypothetical protein HY548_02285 [Elusimicrobia bacterium]|nr:hypothetical protein [Elusimicrobiota bacterium]
MSPDIHSVAERLSALETKLDLILGELSSLKETLVDFQQSQARQDTVLERHSVELRAARTVAYWILGPLFGAIGVGSVLAIFYTLIR